MTIEQCWSTEANTRLRERVSQYKAQGATWEQNGDALGISRQTAWDRYGNRSKEMDAEIRRAARAARTPRT